MRSLILVFLLTAACSASAVAQDVRSTAEVDPLLRPSLGIQGGLTYSKLLGARDFGFQYDYPYTFATKALIRFNDFGYGIGPLVGLSLQSPLTKRLGVIGRVNYTTLNTSTTETATRHKDPEVLGEDQARITSAYSQSLSYLGLTALLRLEAFSQFYVMGGVGVSSLLSHSFEGSGTIAGSSNVYSSSATSAGLPSVSTGKLSPDYYETIRAEAKVGLGKMISLSESLTLTPELTVSLPITSLFSSEMKNKFSSIGAKVPNLYYAQLTVGINMPIGPPLRETYIPEDHVAYSDPNPYVTEKQRKEAAEKKPAGEAQTTSTTIKGVIRDEKTGKPIHATVTATDLSNGSIAYTTETDEDGNYTLDLKTPGNYSITAEASGHLFRSLPAYLDAGGANPRDISLSLSDAHGTTPLLVFYGFNDAKLARESEPELMRVVRLMKTTPDMEIEVSGHTDTVGTSEYNQSLSQRRAQSVAEFLISHGVESKRIAALGRGEAMPVAPNDTEEGRAKNRRVELRVK